MAGIIGGVFYYNGAATNGGSAKLWPYNSTTFPAGIPAQDDALPGSGQVGATLTTGVAYGCAGAFAWDSIADGEYIVSVEYSGAIVYMTGLSVYTDVAVRPYEFVIDGGGVAITTGIKGDLVIPVACTIQQVTLLADQSGSIVVDIWKDTYANYPPTVADTITAAAKPTITTATKSQDATLTGWTTAIAAGDTLRFNVDSCTSITRVTLVLQVNV